METQTSLPGRKIQRIAIAANPQSREALREAEKIAESLQAHGCQVVCGKMDEEAVRRSVETRAVDLLIALGGDGTMLRAGHLCAPFEIPIMGINLGSFGFLTEVQRGQWPEALPKLLGGQAWFERRMMLRTERWRGETKLGVWHAVNEAVVGHGRIKRPVHLETYVDGHYLTTYVADGLIVSTPTGSTAYALAAGGPILPPDLRNVLIVPVAPHLLIDRAVVLAEGSAVMVRVKAGQEVVLTVDGQLPIDLREQDRVQVSVSEHNVSFVRLREPSYFYQNITQYLNRNPAGKGNP